jgi:hypothetical protein
VVAKGLGAMMPSRASWFHYGELVLACMHQGVGGKAENSRPRTLRTGCKTLDGTADSDSLSCR